MSIAEGYAYHIKDDYFKLAQDGSLMKNKEGNNLRPTFFCLRDPNTSLLWMVPMSTQVEKYKIIAQRSIDRYGQCTTIVFGDFAGKPNAFLLQNIFPITDKYIAHPHTVSGNPVPISHSIRQEVLSDFRQLITLIRRGKKVVFPDVLRLEKLMLEELAHDRALEEQPKPLQDCKTIADRLAAAKVLGDKQQAERAAHEPPAKGKDRGGR